MKSLQTLIAQYRSKGVLVDANLLVGFLVGTFNPQLLRQCRATKNFAPEDFTLLVSFLDRFERIVTTPHVLTEASNLAGRLPESTHSGFRAVFAPINPIDG